MKAEPHPLLGEIARWLATYRMAESTFGYEATGDPNLMRQLRQGREPRRRTIERVRRYMLFQ